MERYTWRAACARFSDRALALANPDNVLPLDAVLASKLGEYTELPPFALGEASCRRAAATSFWEFAAALRAAVMTARRAKEQGRDAYLPAGDDGV